MVDTVGFDGNKGMTAIPGGASARRIPPGRALPDVEQRINPGGDVYLGGLESVPTPHTYEFRYHRLPQSYEPRPPLACDPFDQERTRFLTTPPQIPR